MAGISMRAHCSNRGDEVLSTLSCLIQRPPPTCPTNAAQTRFSRPAAPSLEHPEDLIREAEHPGKLNRRNVCPLTSKKRTGRETWKNKALLFPSLLQEPKRLRRCENLSGSGSLVRRSLVHHQFECRNCQGMQCVGRDISWLDPGADSLGF